MCYFDNPQLYCCRPAVDFFHVFAFWYAGEQRGNKLFKTNHWILCRWLLVHNGHQSWICVSSVPTCSSSSQIIWVRKRCLHIVSLWSGGCKFWLCLCDDKRYNIYYRSTCIFFFMDGIGEKADMHRWWFLRDIFGCCLGAMNQLAKNLACEWAKDNIRTNSVAPWYMKTSLVEDVRHCLFCFDQS